MYIICVSYTRHIHVRKSVGFPSLENPAQLPARWQLPERATKPDELAEAAKQSRHLRHPKGSGAIGEPHICTYINVSCTICTYTCKCEGSGLLVDCFASAVDGG